MWSPELAPPYLGTKKAQLLTRPQEDLRSVAPSTDRPDVLPEKAVHNRLWTWHRSLRRITTATEEKSVVLQPPPRSPRSAYRFSSCSICFRSSASSLLLKFCFVRSSTSTVRRNAAS
jgi:hypothetical protein